MHQQPIVASAQHDVALDPLAAADRRVMVARIACAHLVVARQACPCASGRQASDSMKTVPVSLATMMMELGVKL